jgi:hypothetical protein
MEQFSAGDLTMIATPVITNYPSNSFGDLVEPSSNQIRSGGVVNNEQNNQTKHLSTKRQHSMDPKETSDSQLLTSKGGHPRSCSETQASIRADSREAQECMNPTNSFENQASNQKPHLLTRYQEWPVSGFLKEVVIEGAITYSMQFTVSTEDTRVTRQNKLKPPRLAQQQEKRVTLRISSKSGSRATTTRHTSASIGHDGKITRTGRVVRLPTRYCS